MTLATHLTTQPMYRVRIAARRLKQGCPSWLQDGLIACAIAVPLWLLLVAVLLVF